jgi:hypothetical protein
MTDRSDISIDNILQVNSNLLHSAGVNLYVIRICFSVSKTEKYDRRLLSILLSSIRALTTFLLGP